MKKKIVSAAAAAVLVGFALLFGQAPVQRVRLWDTDLSHSLLFQWNEDDVAGRTLNFLVDGASRSLSIFGDTWVSQDYRIAATPTFAGLYLQSSTAAPFLNMTNESATERDPVHRWSVGATPEVKFTHGLDDSDSDSLKWTNVDGLVDTVTGGMGWGTYLVVSDVTNNRMKEHLASDLTYHAQVAATAPGWTCTDGTHYYVTFAIPGGFNGVRKYQVSDNALVWSIGGAAGNGDDEFNNPCGITTDGVHLYIADKGNTRIKKHLASTGAYVAKIGTAGVGLGQFLTPTGITNDRIYLYITEGAPGAAPLLKKHLCSTLAGVSQISADGHLDATNCESITTDENFLWLLNTNNGIGSTIFKYSRSLAYISEYGTQGAGNTQFAGQAVGIATDKTYLYVSDTNNDRIKQHLCSDYLYVAKFGSFGAGDNNFSGPMGISVGFLGEGRTGKLLELWQDGSRLEVYPKIFLYNYLVFLEDSSAASDWIAFRAPTSITASYDLTLPSASAGAKKHLYVDAYDNLQWGQNVDADGSPTLVRLTLTQAAGTSPFVITSNTVNTNLNSDLLDGKHDTGFGPSGAKYITQEADATLTAEQALSILATGILKNTTGTGVLSIATSGTDYEAGLGNPDADGKVLSSTALGVRSWILPGGALALDDLTDVNAPAPNDDDVLTWDDGTSKWVPTAGGGGGAPVDAQYVTLAVDGTLSNERVLTAGTGIKLTDAGAGSTITAAADPDRVQRQDWVHEHFDGLNTATIIGQGSYNEAGAWIDDGMAAGSTAEVTVKAGADKMLTIMNNAAAGNTNSYISSMISTRTYLNGGGHVHVKAKIDQDGAGYGGRFFTIMDGAGGVGAQPFNIYFRYSTTFQLAFWNGGGTKIMDCSKNTWYTIDAYWGPAGSTGGQVTIFVDGVFRYAAATAISSNEWDRISISSYSPAGGNDCTLDVDDLMVYSTMPLGITY